MWNTPDECTGVVQVLQEYDRLTRPEQDRSIVGRLNFDQTPTSSFGSSFKTQTSNKTNSLLAKRGTGDREKDVALLCAKGKISQLENESKLLMTERKRARIEHDKEREIRQGKYCVICCSFHEQMYIENSDK